MAGPVVRCANGHPMRLRECGFISPDCDECGVELHGWRLNCETCGYDVCNPCVDQERVGALRCTRGHPLSMTDGEDWSCDACRADGMDAPRMHCEPCGYDFCGRCVTAALLSRADEKRKRAAEAAAAADAAAAIARTRAAAVESERAAAVERERASALLQLLERERAAAMDRERAALERERAAAAVERTSVAAAVADDRASAERPLRVRGAVPTTADSEANEAKAAPLIAFLRDAISDPEADASVTRYALMLLDEGFETVVALEGLDDGDLVRALDVAHTHTHTHRHTNARTHTHTQTHTHTYSHTNAVSV